MRYLLTHRIAYYQRLLRIAEHQRRYPGPASRLLGDAVPARVPGRARHGPPLIEDDAFLGAGAGVCGWITVGADTKIGPLALVNPGVPAGAVVATRGSMLQRPTRRAA